MKFVKTVDQKEKGFCYVINAQIPTIIPIGPPWRL